MIDFKEVLLSLGKKYFDIFKLSEATEENKLFYICGSESLPPPLSVEEEKDALMRISNNDPDVKNLLIEHNLRLVVYVARKFESTGIGIEDLISIGTIGLIKAINTFNPEKNIKLATYASRCIENEILMYLRKNSSQRTEISIDEPLNVDWDGNELLLSDVLCSDNDEIDRNLEEQVDRELLSKALRTLNGREKQIMMMRFGIDKTPEKTQKEVADMLGISQSYISRLEKRIILRLKKEIARML